MDECIKSNSIGSNAVINFCFLNIKTYEAIESSPKIREACERFLLLSAKKIFQNY